MDPHLAWPMDQQKSLFFSSDDGLPDGCGDGDRLAEGSRVGLEVAVGEEALVGKVEGGMLGVCEGRSKKIVKKQASDKKSVVVDS
jgi:hypothetical protein